MAAVMTDVPPVPPMPMMAYNPAYYPKLIDDAGFEGVQDLLAYRLEALAGRVRHSRRIRRCAPRQIASRARPSTTNPQRL